MFIMQGGSLIYNLLLTPISILGLQSVFTGSFSISHIGGTWFISCITICYLIYPYLQELINQLSNKTKTVLLLVLIFILLWSPLFQRYFHLASIYDNPLIRLLEFFIGVLIANLNITSDCKFVNLVSSKWSWIVASIALFIGVNIAIRLQIGLGDYMLYSWISLPAFIVIIMSLGKLSLPSLQNCKLIRYLSSISYAFFLAQFFVWAICRKIFAWTEYEGNLFKITLSLSLCFIIAIAMHEMIEKPVGKWLKKKLITRWQCL